MRARAMAKALPAVGRMLTAEEAIASLQKDVEELKTDVKLNRHQQRTMHAMLRHKKKPGKKRK